MRECFTRRFPAAHLAERCGRAPPDARRDAGLYAAPVALRPKDEAINFPPSQRSTAPPSNDAHPCRLCKAWPSQKRSNLRLGQRVRVSYRRSPGIRDRSFKVTNRQYLDFIAAGGYETQSFWSADDWAWKVSRCDFASIVLEENGDQWLWRGMFDEMPLPLDWPVYVSHAEASAYARWAGKSLPTEAEWQRAAYGSPRPVSRDRIPGEAPHQRHPKAISI